jgi:hypothetical protein
MIPKRASPPDRETGHPLFVEGSLLVPPGQRRGRPSPRVRGSEDDENVLSALRRAMPLAIVSAGSGLFAYFSRLPHSGFPSVGVLPAWLLLLGIAVITAVGAAAIGLVGENDATCSANQSVTPAAMPSPEWEENDIPSAATGSPNPTQFGLGGRNLRDPDQPALRLDPGARAAPVSLNHRSIEAAGAASVPVATTDLTPTSRSLAVLSSVTALAVRSTRVVLKPFEHRHGDVTRFEAASSKHRISESR